ncbi:MBL fold metallo-hydrolase [Chitinophaga filiformis]|uniref:MBL fold metallo-hydrolase n=1 Tax=Chitinophaga filiformis TaxID=104663 RepID=UPI001F2B8FA9|nr:MBL fold metallo-hydrolase [Chitinophaga filiformis]MCF6406235.1 MBL fold metallo-hydrolase [Chitinophaga filiformis]
MKDSANEQLQGKQGDFYYTKYGFEKAHWHEHAPSPQQFQPAYLHSSEFVKNGYHCEELRDGFYWVTSGGYDAAFMVTKEGVIAIDAPPILGENMLAAIESVTDKPIVKVIYSHWHSDHIGAAAMYGPDVEIIAHEITRELLVRFPDPLRPVPTHTFTDTLLVELGGEKLELSYKGANHCPGNIFMYAPKQKALVKIDIVSPGSCTFMHCDASENISGWIEAHEQILEFDFDFLVGGHITRWGTRADVLTSLEYFQDMLAFAEEALLDMCTPNGAAIFFTTPPVDQYSVGTENWINSMVNYVTEKMLSKVTSNGQKWEERLAGVTTNTKYHAYTVVESTRTERSHKGYQKRGTGGTNYFV